MNTVSTPNPAIAVAARRTIWPRFFVCALLMAAVVAVFYGVQSWRQWTRPGTRHYLRGMELASSKQYVQAEKEWLQGVQEDPKSVECYESLGDLYAVVRQYDKAARFYDSAGKLAPDDGEIFLKQMRTQQNLGDIDKAYVAAKQAAKLLPENGEAVGEYGVYAAHFKNRVAAAEALRKAHALAPDNEHYLIALVLLELDASNWQLAEQHLQPLLERQPNHAEANYYMAVIYNQKPRTRENLAAALKYVQRSVSNSKREVRTYLLLGQLYLDSNQPEKALQVYSEAVSYWPIMLPFYNGLSQCYIRLGNPKKQAEVAATIRRLTVREDRMEFLKHALGFNKRDIPVALELALLYEEEGSLQSARGAYELALKAGPRDPRVQKQVKAFYNRIAKSHNAQVLEKLAKQGSKADTARPATPKPAAIN